MTADLLRSLWSVVTRISSTKASNLSDDSLMDLLLDCMNQKQPLSFEEQATILDYLSSRKLLIREVLLASRI
jgi:hypothetical protein